MPVKFTKKKDTVSAADLLKTFQSDYGDSIGSFGGKLVNSDRISTGIFELDVAMGGGFPRGKASMLYGPESSGKTNAAMLAVAMHQRTWPDKVCAFVDIEHAFDPEWAQALGVDTKKLVVLKPSFAEQAVDMIESLLYANDCGLVVVDSIAALTTSAELDSSAEKAQVGGSAIAIGKLIRKTTIALSEAEKEDRYPTLIYINQISYKIGVMFGDPETYPGGARLRHQCGMIVRLYGKNVTDPKISQTMPVAKETTYIIRKWKCPIHQASGKFTVAMIAHDHLKPGQSDDFSFIQAHLKSFGMFEKDDAKGWSIAGEHYPVISAFKARIYEDPMFASGIRKLIVDRLMSTGKFIEEGDAQEHKK